jgi:hypothetical protein
MKEAEKSFFKLPGDLGRFIGSMKQSDVISLFSETKVGKTWMLVDIFKHAVMSRRNTVFFSIEMTGAEINQRIDQAFHPMSSKGSGVFEFPEFDCAKNQTGECADRASEVVVLDGEELIPDPNHVVCQKCMRTDPDRYVYATYTSLIDRDSLDPYTVKRVFREGGSLSRLQKHGVIVAGDKYDLTYNNIILYIEALKVEGFYPDIIIIDYADILDIRDVSDQKDWRLEDERWKLLPKLYKHTKSLLITATQAKSSDSEVMSSNNQRGYKGKSMHVNKMIGMKQTDDNKRNGELILNISETRSGEYYVSRTCTVLQDLNSGQGHLDSYCKDYWRSLIALKKRNEQRLP